MSDERLDQALNAMKQDAAADDGAEARERVWARLAGSPAMLCASLRAELPDYLGGRLPEARRELVEDHLSRCAECRNAYAELKGEVKVVAMPAARPPLRMRWQSWALAAGVAALLLYAGRDRIDTLLAPGGARATVETASGAIYKLPDTTLARGAALMEGDTLRTGPGAHAVLRLADGSSVEVNERTELRVSAAWSGQTVQLERGDVIVEAAKQRRGHLRVATRDSVASVKGTVFAVSTGLSGSLVSVLEGSVAVSQPGTERMLTRGQQAGSNPSLEAAPVVASVSWSQNLDKYIALLGDFAKLEKQLAALPTPALRSEARLLAYLPAGTLVYVAAPNLAGTIRQAVALADQQASESATFKEWWTSAAGAKAKLMLDHVQTLVPMLGDEIVFALAANGTQRIPLLVAEVKAGQQEGLKKALAEVPNAQFRVTDKLMLVSDSAANLNLAGTGAQDAFAAAIAKRYQRGVGWLIAMNVAGFPTDAQHHTVMDGEGMKYVFFEQRQANGIDENEATLAFAGARTGISSWLAVKGTSGAAEYLSSDAIAAFSASTRDPKQLFEEVLKKASLVSSKAPEHLRELEAKLGIHIADDLAGALGTDFAFGIETPTLPVPGYVLAAEVNKPATLDGTITKLVDAFNAELKPADQAKRLTLGQETTNGRLWKTLKAVALSQQVAWTYDRGYLVLSNDLGLASRAIQTRNGGSPLVHSAAFERLLPSSVGANPSGFVWLNTKGALSSLAAQIPNAALQKLAADRDPVLVVLSGETEQIRLLSRTRITSLVLDLMMTGSATGASRPADAMGLKRGRV